MEQQQLFPNINSSSQNSKTSPLHQLLNQSYEKVSFSSNPVPYICNTHYKNIYQPVQSQQNSFSQPFISFSRTPKETHSKLGPQPFDIHQINADNVFQILEQHNFNELKLLRNILNRREFGALNIKLKNILLIKYHLNQITQTRANQVIPKSFENLWKSSRKKELKMKSLIIRKLHKVLWKKIQGSGLQPEQRYIQTLKLISEIQQAHGKQSLQFQKSFIQLIRKINDNDPIKDSCLQNYLNSAFAQKPIIYDQTFSIKDYCSLQQHGLSTRDKILEECN